MVRSSLFFSAFLLALALAGCGPKAKTEVDGNAPNAKQGDGGKLEVAKVDLAKGPNGEVIVQVDEGKERKSGYKSKTGKTVIRHGPCVLFYDQLDGKKRWEGDYYDNALHGKLTGWYKDGSLWFERWYDKGKPVGTHKGYGNGGKVVWELTYDDGKPRLNDVDCFCVVCQLGFLYGTSTWTFSNPNGEDSTVYRFTNGIATGFTERDFVRLLGSPSEKRDVRPDRPGFPVHEQDWVYRCKDGTVTCRISTVSSPLTMTQTKVSGRRKF